MARRTTPILGLALALGACAPDTYFPPNDFDRRGTWQAEGINDRNLRAQIADPAHLTRGAAAATDRGQAGSAAIQALEAGRRPALPAGFSEVGQQSSGAAGVSSGGGGAN
ncbi:hypothetical protein GXW74_08975 [Roseomonas eburnea]|uniref:DUF3035 domain-containing protein n=1 Tax=Neoroseomonas eburnea TaxID=1346889 RepID=A0A9X9XA82_9PROT|nr:hypothetical protein [Neoroseomonas eburnea]MBR0680618.1 hypothetical protein [Neoroseomonas eburnea]